MGLSLKLNHVLLFVYLFLISLVLKEIQYVALIFAVLLFFFDKYIHSDLRNLVYVLVSLVPFLPLFVIFVIYLPYMVFGLFIENISFLKRYLMGFSFSFFFSIILYYAFAGPQIPLHGFFLYTFFYIPVLAVLVVWKFKKKAVLQNISSIFKINTDNYIIILVTLFFLFFVAHVNLTDHSLFMSNGTQLYTKFSYIVKSIEGNHEFPLYDPGGGMGEQIFITDSTFFYHNLATIFSFLKGWVSPVLFFNTYQVFILWLSILGASVFLSSLIGTREKDYKSTLIITVGSLAIGLSFFFIHWLESFKQFSALPVNFLLFSIIISVPKKPSEFSVILYLLILSFFIHGIQAIGVGLILLFLFIILFITQKHYLYGVLEMVSKNKFKLLFIFILAIFMMVGYYGTGELYKQYGFWERPNEAIGSFPISINYLTDFIAGNASPLSFKYPDIQKLDAHKY